MGNRKYETQTRINSRGNPVNKVFAYTKNNLNQYQDRLVYTGVTTDTEIIPETNTGTVEEDLTETGEIEILNTEILEGTGSTTETGTTEEESFSVQDYEGQAEIVDLQGRLLYDKNGNMIGNLLNNKRQYIYSYDYKNRLVKIEKTIYKKVNGTETNEVEQITRIIEYKYDVLGRRIKRINNNLTYTKYYYSNQNLIQEEYYTKTNILKNQKNYVYSNQTDGVLTMENIDYKTRKIQQEYVNNKGVTKIRTIREEYTETNTYYYEKDEKGSITKITDKDGTTIEQYLYDAYGTPYTKTQSGELVTISNLKPSLIGNTRLYTGREYDRGLQLYYNRARYYNPQLGRFLSRDPIDISDDVNLYTYVGNNPLNYIDLYGLEGKPAIKKYEYPLMYKPAVALENIMGAPLSSIGIDPTTVASFIGLNASMIGGDRVNLNISSYMLAKFMYGNGGSESYDNNHWISQRVKYTNFYNDQINSIRNKVINDDVGVLRTDPLFPDATDGVGTISERFDFGTSFGSIQGTISGIKNEDGTITTTLYIKDEYKYYYKDRIGDTITNPFNSMGKYYQDKGYGTPFMWELNITETFKN